MKRTRAVTASATTIYSRRRGALHLAIAAASLAWLFVLILPSAPARAAESCPNEEIRASQGSTFLPACRAFEQVSPPDKGGYPVLFQGTRAFGSSLGLTGGSRNGETVVFHSWGSFAGSSHAMAQQPYRSRRGSTGWTTVPVAPPPTVKEPDALTGAGALAWSTGTPSLDFGLTVTDNQWSSLDTNENAIFGAQGNDVYITHPDGKVELGSVGSDGLATGGNLGNSGFRVNQLSDDGAYLAFTTYQSALPEDETPEGAPRLNLHSGQNGSTRLVGIDPDGNQIIDECGVKLPAVPLEVSYAASAMSDDADAIVFESPPQHFPEMPVQCEPRAQEAELYVRLNPSRPQSPVDASGCTVPADACTVRISASQRTNPAPTEGPPKFVQLSADGGSAFFLSGSALTDDANETPGVVKLYEFDLQTGELHFIAGETGREIHPFIGVSESGRRAYFAHATDGLYYSEAGEIHKIDTSETGPVRVNSRALITPDGQALLFVGDLQQEHLYLYRDGAGVKCITCAKSGPYELELALGSSGVDSRRNLFASSLSEDGRRVVFGSREAFVPTDRNGRYDVYEWELSGSDSCVEGTVAGGCLRLISTGTWHQDSFLLGMSRSGRDVFFATAESLTASDIDDGDLDVYDARIGGGFPEPKPEALPSCEGSACQGPLNSPASRSTPPSASFRGPSNHAARKACRKKRAKQRHKAQRRKPCRASGKGKARPHHSRNVNRGGSK